MQFINIVVHSVEDMNFRIHLQFEFTKLGLDEFLEKLRHTESDELQVQISAYLDNVFDVAGLMEDSETKSAALERVVELEDQLSMVKTPLRIRVKSCDGDWSIIFTASLQMHERYQELECEAEVKQLELEAQLNAVVLERDKLMELHKETDEELHTLRKAVSKHEEESQNRQSLLESKIQELEIITNSLPRDAAKSAATKGSVTMFFLWRSVVDQLCPCFLRGVVVTVWSLSGTSSSATTSCSTCRADTSSASAIDTRSTRSTASSRHDGTTW